MSIEVLHLDSISSTLSFKKLCTFSTFQIANGFMKRCCEKECSCNAELNPHITVLQRSQDLCHTAFKFAFPNPVVHYFRNVYKTDFGRKASPVSEENQAWPSVPYHGTELIYCVTEVLQRYLLDTFLMAKELFDQIHNMKCRYTFVFRHFWHAYTLEWAEKTLKLALKRMKFG